MWSFSWFSKGFWYTKSQNTSFKIRVLWYRGTSHQSHNLIKSYLTVRKHYTHINGVVSNTLTSTHRIPQGSVLGLLLFLVYVNDMSQVIQHSEMHHFADDTNLSYSSNSMKKINKFVNHDLKIIVHWLRANRISLNPF